MPIATRLAVTAAALAAGAGVLAGPASADVRDFADPAGPVGAVDIRNVRVDNSTARPERVIVNVRMRTILFGDGMTVYVDTAPADAGPEYKITAFANSEYVFRRVETWGGRGRNVSCDGDTFRLAAGERRARIVLPRVCLGDPGRVRIAVHAYREGSADWAAAARSWLGFVRR